MKTDVLIIGGGSIGLNCAYYLLKSGREVTILESKEIPKASAAFGLDNKEMMIDIKAFRVERFL